MDQRQHREGTSGLAAAVGLALALLGGACAAKSPAKDDPEVCAPFDLSTQIVGCGADPGKAVVACGHRCDAGDARACTQLGLLHERACGVPESAQSVAEAVKLYRKACEADDRDGCNLLAGMYRKGKGVEQDVDRAVQLYRAGCDAANDMACHNLGMMFKDGIGVEASHERAVALFRPACEHDNPLACQALGWSYLRGEGVAHSDAEAARLFERSCAHSTVGCVDLARLLMEGRGAAKDVDRAVSLFERACRHGVRVGCSNAARHHERQGEPARAQAWHAEACKLGHTPSCERRAAAAD